MKQLSTKSRKTKFRRGEIQPEIAARLGLAIPENDSERTISPNEAASVLGITGEAIKQWVYHGRLPAVKLQNGYWRIKVGDLSKFLESRLGSPAHSILIGQSDSKTMETVVQTVEGLGHTVLLANSDVDAILKLKNERPSVLILDLDHSSGWQLLDKLNAIPPRNMLLLAGSKLSEDQINRVTESGAKAVLQKPLDQGVLKRELARIVSK